MTTFTNQPVADLNTEAQYLTTGFWDDMGGYPHHWSSNTITYNFNGLTAPEQNLATTAMQMWADVAPLNFVQTNGSADITFTDNEDANGNAYAETNVSYSDSGPMQSAQINISSLWYGAGQGNLYSYAYQSYIHEIGHALGLGHLGPYDESNPPIVYGNPGNNKFANDTWQYSVMSYFDQSNYGGATEQWVMTPQMADIVAISSLYGLQTSHVGDTVYGFNCTAENVFNFNNYALAPCFTIHDSQGNDTLDCSGYSQDQVISLVPGSFSSIGGGVNNIGIDPYTNIENAIGGSGNDTLISGASGDTLTGGLGSNVFKGTGENLFHDKITDFSLSDTIDITDMAYLQPYFAGTASGSFAYYDPSTNMLQYVAENGQLNSPTSCNIYLSHIPAADSFALSSDGSGGTLLKLVSAPPTSLYVDSSNDFRDYDGAPLNEMSFGPNVKASFDASQINDTAIREVAYDPQPSSPDPSYLLANAAITAIAGGVNCTLAIYADTSIFDGKFFQFGQNWSLSSTNKVVVYGTNANASIYGVSKGVQIGISNNTTEIFYGEGATDYIYGGIGHTTLVGSSGSETFYSASGTDYMYGGTSYNTMVGGSGSDTFYSGGGTDYLYGGSGTNTMDTGSGLGYLYGSTGTDYLNGGTGKSVLFGGSGTEIFHGGGSGSQSTMVDGSGKGYFYSGGGLDYVYGGSGTTTMFGGAGKDTLYGGSGTDTMYGGTGVNTLVGGSGTETYYGGGGTDYMLGGTGLNTFTGGAGTAYVYNEGGTDYVHGGSGHTDIYGGSGTDYVYTGAGGVNLSAGSGKAYLFEQAAGQTAGRYDEIDGFKSPSTFIYMPRSEVGSTSFVSQNGGTAVLTQVQGGTSEIFVAGASAAAVRANTFFGL